MKIGNTSYRGMAPRITPRALPEGAAQQAVNCRLKRGDIEPWRQFAQTTTLTGISNPATIFRLKGTTWLAFSQQTDIARAAVSGGLDNRVLLTCPALYPTPRYTDFVAATTGSPPYPVITYPLGVPAPDGPPDAVLGVDSTPTEFSIDVLDEGDSLDTQWITSPQGSGSGLFSLVQQETSGGNPGTCYSLSYDESRPGAGPFAYRNFGIGSATVIRVTADFQFTLSDNENPRRAGLAVATTADGVGCGVQVYDGSTLRIVNQVDEGGWYGCGVVDSTACALSYGTWYTFDVTMTVKPNGSQTVVAKVFNGTTLVASLTATSVFIVGDYVGINAAAGNDAAFIYRTLYDNIRARASGSTGVTPNLTAVNYVYTYVNDLGEEGAPSFPTQDLLRPDGVTVTLTTLTAAPVVDGVTYSKVTNKRIYRLVSGTTGDVYRLVTEIPLATADFVDDLTDNELPTTILESDEYDLPHPDMQGIITLPNSLCAGFFENQLCLSATGWCHAWPVRQRLRVDSDIVAICNINNTIVIGTNTFVYTATGNDGASYSMSKPGAAQACTSKLGMTFLDGQGVIFPSPDGWCVCAGSANNVPVVSEGVFTKEQWQQYDPTSIIAAVHDNVLHWYWKTTAAPVDTNTLFLFHVTDFDSDPSEGLEEFLTDTTAMDQTGATWTSDSIDWLTRAASPSPKFGLEYLSAANGGSITWTRDASQTLPVQSTIAIGSRTALTMDLWAYRPTGASGGIQVRVGGAYPDYFIISLDEFGTQAAHWGAGIFLTASVISSNQWVHIRLTYDGDLIRLFVDGTLTLSSSSTPNLLAGIDPISTMQVRIENFGSGGFYADEIYAELNTSASTASFTPPTSPWPNP